MGQSAELARWLRAWLRDRGHVFRPANLGISAAACSRCGVVITVRGRISSSTYVWILDTGCPDWPSPHQLRKALQVVPDCGIPIVLEVMES